MKISVEAQALSLSRVEERVTSLMEPLLQHYLKCKQYPHSPNLEHWKMEILGWLARMSIAVTNVKTKTHKVKESLLRTWMLELVEPRTIRNMLLVNQAKYGKSNQVIELSEISNVISSLAPMLLDKSNPLEVLRKLLS